MRLLCYNDRRKMPEKLLRFTITDGQDKRAATWKCWTNTGKSDFYLSCRELSDIKISFHESGRWRVAYTQESFDNPDRWINRPTERKMVSVECPLPFFPGCIMVLQIYTPSAAVSIPLQSMPKGTIFIPTATLSMFIETTLVMTSSDVAVTSWPSASTMKTSLVGYLRLANADTVWIVYRAIQPPPMHIAGKIPAVWTGQPPSA